jgi:hypothetical protein
VPDLRFVRQRRVDDSHVGIVIPDNAELNPILAHRLGRDPAPPTDSPRTFSFTTWTSQSIEALLRDGAKADSGVYQFAIRDAGLGVFDLPRFRGQKHKPGSTCQTVSQLDARIPNAEAVAWSLQ